MRWLELVACTVVTECGLRIALRTDAIDGKVLGFDFRWEPTGRRWCRVKLSWGKTVLPSRPGCGPGNCTACVCFSFAQSQRGSTAQRFGRWRRSAPTTGRRPSVNGKLAPRALSDREKLFTPGGEGVHIQCQTMDCFRQV